MPDEIAQYFAWLRPIMQVVMPLIAFGGLVALGLSFWDGIKRWFERRQR